MRYIIMTVNQNIITKHVNDYQELDENTAQLEVDLLSKNLK